MHIAVAISNRIMAIFCCHHNCILCMILLTRMGSHAGLHNCACCLNTGLDDYMVSICVATGHIETYPKWFADKPTRTHSVNSQTGQLMEVFDGKLWLDNRSWCGFLKRIPRIRRPGAGATERFKKWYGSKFAKGRKWEWYRLFFPSWRKNLRERCKLSSGRKFDLVHFNLKTWLLMRKLICLLLQKRTWCGLN